MRFEMLPGWFWVVLGIVIALLVVGNFGIVPAYKAAMAKCEQSLPRDQRCIITAVKETE